MWVPSDAVASRYGVQCQGCDELALTLLDVLDYMEEVPIVTQYRLSDGSLTTRFPMGKTLDDAHARGGEGARLALRHHRGAQV